MTRSTPERLDAAVDRVLAGELPLVEEELRPLVGAAARLSGALRPFPVAGRFETRLAAELARRGRRRGRAVERVASRFSRFTRRELARPGRLLAAGAVSSAAVGVTVTAFALWRSARRQPAQRLLHR